MSLPSCASKKNHLISDVSNSLEESCCISASCWLHVWRIQLSIQTDNFTALVRALRSWYNLIALWDCIFFIFYVCIDWILELFIEELPDDCIWLAEVSLELYASLYIVGDIFLVDHVQTNIIGLPCIQIRL